MIEWNGNWSLAWEETFSVDGLDSQQASPPKGKVTPKRVNSVVLNRVISKDVLCTAVQTGSQLSCLPSVELV